ncbi:MAG: thioredoxin family protein [candidate division Zixibacteria bacterium]|nr:thioredoxin family protein [candidate division Zixibacteria bacterium]
MNSNSPTITADPITWVGTSAIYNTFDGKKEYSIMFFYTDWCGYCHKMDEFTFTDPTVANIMNQYFNSVRVNAESDTLLVHFDSTLTGRQMKLFYEIGGYPTTCVFKGDGEYLTRGIGYTNPADFAAGLNRVLSGE